MNSGPDIKARIRRYAVWAICAAPVVLAFSRAGQRVSPDVQPGQANIFERPHDKADAERQRAMHPGPVSEEEWLKAEEFLKLHAPVRYDLIKFKIPSGEPRESLKRFLVNKWRSIVQLEGQSQDLYKTRIREVELDDEVFGICLKLKHNRNDKQLQGDLNNKITELFNVGLNERQQRIGLIEKSLGEQKKSLESDERDKTRLIEQYYETILAHGVEGARLEPHHPNAKGKPSDSTTPSSPGDGKSE